MRILSLDVGDARIGAAFSDGLELGARPLLTVTRRGGLARDIEAVVTLAAKQEADAIVVGMPLSADGGEGRQAVKTRRFVNRLSIATPTPVYTWDESLTSVEAEERMLALDYSRDRRRQLRDQWAAAIILESYLEANRCACL
jgi:putative Holliday junction resolvase